MNEQGKPKRPRTGQKPFKKHEGKGIYCVNCLTPAESLYTVYSQDVIRVTECVSQVGQR